MESPVDDPLKNIESFNLQFGLNEDERTSVSNQSGIFQLFITYKLVSYCLSLSDARRWQRVK